MGFPTRHGRHSCPAPRPRIPLRGASGPAPARAWPLPYVEGRGVDPEVARRFGLGYAPEGWDHLLAFMRGQSVTEEGLAQAGLVLPRQTGSGFYDRFRGRLLFTIRDGQGRVVAFRGRALAPPG